MRVGADLDRQSIVVETGQLRVVVVFVGRAAEAERAAEAPPTVIPTSLLAASCR